MVGSGLASAGAELGPSHLLGQHGGDGWRSAVRRSSNSVARAVFVRDMMVALVLQEGLPQLLRFLHHDAAADLRRELQRAAGRIDAGPFHDGAEFRGSATAAWRTKASWSRNRSPCGDATRPQSSPPPRSG